jgi:hypothetical protein
LRRYLNGRYVSVDNREFVHDVTYRSRTKLPAVPRPIFELWRSRTIRQDRVGAV